LSSAATDSERPVYLDASALVKLVLPEPASSELRDAVRNRSVVSSDLAVAEVPRAVRRRAAPGQPVTETLERLIRSLALVPIGLHVLSMAGALPAANLGTLDAIHVASALTVADDIDVFVSYDHRQLEAASRMGLAVASPGA
jgi:uncharacterized protein